MRDELVKISTELKVHHAPVGALAQHGFVGKYFDPEAVKSTPVLQQAAQGKKHLLVLPQKADFRTLLEGRRDYIGKPELVERAGNAAYQSSRRHELTHYLRQKKGKMARYGKPGVRGLLSTGREEAIAYSKGLSPLKRISEKSYVEGMKGVIPGTIGSVRQAYPQGLRAAAMGGRLGGLIRAGKKLIGR